MFDQITDYLFDKIKENYISVKNVHDQSNQIFFKIKDVIMIN